MFTVYYHPQAEKEAKKLSKILSHKTREMLLSRLENTPCESGIRLVGGLKGFYKIKVIQAGVNYRIIYSVNEEKKEVWIAIMGPRENLYDRLMRRLGMK